MTRERTLFERLRNPESEAPRTVYENTEKLFMSVLNHLRKMLNSRQGHALIQPSYGMPDFTEFRHDLPDAVKAMEDNIRHTIERYEPRLKNVQVHSSAMAEGQTRLHFEVMAELVTADEEASVLFETRIDSSGYISIKG